MENRIFGRLTYRFYRIIAWFSIALAIILTCLRLAAGYFAPSEKQLIQWAQHHFADGLNIQSAKLDFLGWSPVVKLQNVEVLTKDAQVALKINQMKAVLNPFSFLLKKIELTDIVIEGMKAGVEYLNDGSFIISDLNNLKWDPNQTQSSLISVRHLVIKNSDIHIVLNDKKCLPLTHVDIAMDAYHHFKISGKATMAGEKPSTLQFIFDLPYFFRREANFYCHWQGADLAQLAHFFPKQSIVQLQAGEMDMKLWATLPQKGAKSIVSKIKLKKVELANDKSEIFAFEPLTASIQLTGDEQNWQLAAKWHEHGMGQDYHLNTKVYPCSQEGWCIELASAQLKTAQIAYWLEKWNVLPDSLENQLKHYDISGLLDSVFVKLKLEKGKMWASTAEIAFSNMSLQSGMLRPSIQTLNGALRYDEGQTDIILESDKAEIVYAPWFVQPIVATGFKGWMTLVNGENPLCQIILSHAKVGQTSLVGGATLQFANNEIADLEINLGTDEWPLTEALSVLPRKVMDKELLAWLDKALKSGKITQSTLLFRGDPKAFPFDKQQGIFDFSAELSDVAFDYHKDWPKLSQLEATLQFKNRQMIVNANKALLEGGELLSTRAVIADLYTKPMMLMVDAKIKNQLDKAEQIILKSPLKDKIGPSLSPLSLQGDLILDLGLKIPLAVKEAAPPTQVLGALNVSNATLRVPQVDLLVENLQGVVSFSESSLAANHLTGLLLDEMTTFHISSQNNESDTTFQIQAEGYLKYESLVKWLNFPAYDFVFGRMPYQAKLVLFSRPDKHPISFEMSSPLTGLTINAPKPFAKEGNVSMETVLKLDIEPKHTIHFTADYGKEVSLALLLASQEDSWKCKGGHLSLGDNSRAKNRDDGVFLIDGHLPEMNIGEWKKFIATDAENKMAVEPLLALNIGKLIFHGETFLKTTIEANRDNTLSLWNLNFDGPSIKGHITIPETKDNRDIVVELDKLTLATGNEEASNWVEDNTVLEHPIEVAIKKLKIDKKILTHFQARIEPSWKGYDFPRVQAKMKGTDIMLSGQWHTLTPSKQVIAEGRIHTKNSTDMFKAIGIAGTIQQAKGDISFSIAWEGSPAKIDYLRRWRQLPVSYPLHSASPPFHH